MGRALLFVIPGHSPRRVPRLPVGIILAGTPTTVAPSGTSSVTTDPAPTIARAPIVTPGRITQWTPTNAPRPTRVSTTRSGPRPEYAFDSSCERIVVRAATV